MSGEPVIHERPVVRRIPGVAVGRWSMAASLLLLNLIDVLITRRVIAAGGEEQNPLMRSAVEHPWAGYVVKFAVTLGVGVLLVRSPRHRRFVDVATVAVVAFYVGVVGWNLYNLWRAGAVGSMAWGD